MKSDERWSTEGQHLAAAFHRATADQPASRALVAALLPTRARIGRISVETQALVTHTRERGAEISITPLNAGFAASYSVQLEQASSIRVDVEQVSIPESSTPDNHGR